MTSLGRTLNSCAIYGCIKSALLWYELFSETLQGMGFVINPYDRCTSNKIINGKQCTIVWYVDDVKVSHHEMDVVKEIVAEMEKIFGKMDPTYGNEQEYLGMKIKITDDRRLEINMNDQINEIINDFSEDITGTVSTPATRTLMDVNDQSTKLCDVRAAEFHSLTAKLLYLEKRGRPDLETTVSFLTTRVSKPTEEDWKKLKRALTYLNQAKSDSRIIGCDSLTSIMTWIDVAFAVHPNMRSHTGGVISLGWGALHARS